MPGPGPSAAGVAPWCLPAAVRAKAAPVELTDQQVDIAIAVASDVMYELTRHRWPGTRDDFVRPAYQGCFRDRAWRWSSYGEEWNGTVPPMLYQQARGLGTALHECGCVVGVTLGGAPIVEIVEVKVDGAVVDPALYRVDNSNTLVRLRDPGHQFRLWPSCQSMDLPDSELDTFSVRYRWGANPPLAGSGVAVSLAAELAMSMLPEDQAPTCRLNRMNTTVVRAGITQTRSSIDVLVAAGMTGLPEVDMWIGAVNRGQAQRRAAVVDPSRGRSVRRTGG